MQRRGWIPSDDKKIVLWIDYACIDQDSDDPAAELNDNMLRIVGMCDMVLTPVVDPEWKSWAADTQRAQINKDVAGEYGAKQWQDYWKRAWCLLEMFFAAHVPFSPELVLPLIGGEVLDFVNSKQARPHVMYGTRESDTNQVAFFLMPLRDEMLEVKNPGDGELFSENDRHKIRYHVKELRVSTLVRQRKTDDAVAQFGAADVASVVDKLAKVHEEQCQFQLQLEMVQLALEVRRRDPESSVPRTLMALGLVFQRLGRFEDAMQALEEALEMQKKVHGHDHVDVAHVHYNMAQVLAKKGDVQAARQGAEQARDIWKMQLGDSHPHTQHADMLIRQLG